MQNEIRQAVGLNPELEDRTFDMQGEAFELLLDKKYNEAEVKIKEAWDLLPEPKFNTSCSHTILCDLIEILTTVGKHEEATPILADWTKDIETCGYRIFETTPFILSGENFLYLNEIEKAKEQFFKSGKYGATKRDFSDKPSFYFDIAKKKLMDNNEIHILFKKEVLENSKKKVTIEYLSDEICDQIEDLSEKGNEYFEEENYQEAINIWEKALTKIPNPQNYYSESQWLETTIGDAFFHLGKHSKALEHFQNAKNNIEENAYENPFIMLRLGQTFLEKNNNEEAKEFLLRAYMFEGTEIFSEEDQKYFKFLNENIDLNKHIT
jgi:tetratricopeptide (TPR) repeat protein